MSWQQGGDPLTDLRAACERLEADAREPLQPRVITDKQAARVQQFAKMIKVRMRLRDRRRRCRSTPFRAWMTSLRTRYRQRPWTDPPRSRWRWNTRAHDAELPF